MWAGAESIPYLLFIPYNIRKKESPIKTGLCLCYFLLLWNHNKRCEKRGKAKGNDCNHQPFPPFFGHENFTHKKFLSFLCFSWKQWNCTQHIWQLWIPTRKIEKQKGSTPVLLQPIKYFYTSAAFTTLPLLCFIPIHTLTPPTAFLLMFWLRWRSGWTSTTRRKSSVGTARTEHVGGLQSGLPPANTSATSHKRVSKWKQDSVGYTDAKVSNIILQNPGLSCVRVGWVNSPSGWVMVGVFVKFEVYG